MSDFLRDYQRDAVNRMHNGCILNGGVGSGKSRTGLYYYFKENGGSIENGVYKEMTTPQDLYIITTARKRDSLEWEGELTNFMLTTDLEKSRYDHKIVIDSWNNIKKYQDTTNAFFIFDEDKVTGMGTWAKTFLKITKSNDWIILSATAGDQWSDYAMVFIANGYYKNITEFRNEHIEYDRFFRNYPKIKRYHHTGRLLRLRNKTLVDMNTDKHTKRIKHDIICDYDRFAYKLLFRDRWNPDKDEPIQNASELCYLARKVCNSDPSRINKVLDIIKEKGKVIIFYNFDYELEILRDAFNLSDIVYTEWNGHKHEDIAKTEEWVYLVQYNSGAEAWNCILTDTIIFYSQNYSYKIMEQAMGRIDRMNTPFHDLHYYHLKSKSPIDISISRALEKKKKFNESKFIGDLIDL